jgi:hypothetical protein
VLQKNIGAVLSVDEGLCFPPLGKVMFFEQGKMIRVTLGPCTTAIFLGGNILAATHNNLPKDGLYSDGPETQIKEVITGYEQRGVPRSKITCVFLIGGKQNFGKDNIATTIAQGNLVNTKFFLEKHGFHPYYMYDGGAPLALKIMLTQNILFGLFHEACNKNRYLLLSTDLNGGSSSPLMNVQTQRLRLYDAATPYRGDPIGGLLDLWREKEALHQKVLVERIPGCHRYTL